MSAEVQIREQADRMAKGRELSQANFATGDDFWTLVDAAGDETYENRVKGQDITNLDAALAAGAVWSTPNLKKWFDLHGLYLQQDLGKAYPYFASYLTEKRWTVPFEFNECHYEGMGARIAGEFVFAKGTRPADQSNPATSNMHKFGLLTGTSGAPTWAIVDGALSAYVKGSAIVIINEDATPAPDTLIMTATLQDATTKDLAVTLAGTQQYKQTVLGNSPIGGAGAPAAQKVIPLATTTMFKAGEWVLVIKADGSVHEVGQIDTISAGVSVTLLTNLANAYVENDLVIPQFTNVTFKSGTLGDGKHLGFWAYPNRIIAL